MEAFINSIPVWFVLILLVVGIVLLIKGADLFVDGSADIAKRLKVSSFVIGMTVVSIGTSLPEFSVSTIASLSGRNELAISNVTGSNIFNVLVVIGVCAVIAAVGVDDDTIKKDIPFLLFSSLILLAPYIAELITHTGEMEVNRVCGGMLALLFIYYIIMMIMRGRKNGKDAEESSDVKGSVIKSILLIIIGGAGIILGGDLTVDCASRIAVDVGMSQTLVGLTIVSVGTSLPELVTSVVAIRKGETGMALGNGIGSCIFNELMIVGFASLISPITLTMENVIDLILMVSFILLTWIFAATAKKINRFEGVLMLGMYVGYMAYIIVR